MDFERIVNIFSRTVAVVITAVFLSYFFFVQLPKEIALFSEVRKELKLQNKKTDIVSVAHAAEIKRATIQKKETAKEDKTEEDKSKKDNPKDIEKSVKIPEMEDRIMGSPDAPVTLYDYSSFTCSHCAYFHKRTLPELKKKFIDKGKLKFIFRDFPLDGRAAAASMLTRCAAKSSYFAFLDIVFEGQDKWAFSDDAKDMLTGYARLGGMTQEEIDVCLENEELLEGLMQSRDDAAEENGISATPTFVLDNGIRTYKITGAHRLNRFEKAIEDMLKEKELHKK